MEEIGHVLFENGSVSERQYELEGEDTGAGGGSCIWSLGLPSGVEAGLVAAGQRDFF